MLDDVLKILMFDFLFNETHLFCATSHVPVVQSRNYYIFLSYFTLLSCDLLCMLYILKQKHYLEYTVFFFLSDHQT